MKSHQRFCDIADNPEFRNLFNNDVVCDEPSLVDDIDSFTHELTPLKKDLKPGLKLPKTKSQWEEANKYFKKYLHNNQDIDNIENEICRMQNCIYDYFKINFGSISEKTRKYRS